MACQEKGQTLSFAGLNVHHQNGIAKWCIHTLQELARTMLIHADHWWPKVVTANLWPYALRMANDVLSETPVQTCNILKSWPRNRSSLIGSRIIGRQIRDIGQA
jgi:hypothetical protein